MRLAVHRFRCPKQGSSRLEYEDAISRASGPEPPYRFAVADGASESSFARLWADLLVEAFRTGMLAPAGAAPGREQVRSSCAPALACFARALRPLQDRWQQRVARRPLPWYAAAKLSAGAFAALAGLTLQPDGAWTALAAGDCCLFQVRDDALLCAFPLDAPDAFDNRPLLIGSNPACNERLAETLRERGGRWQPGDAFLLMSDAIAAYFLRRVADGATPGEALPFTRRSFRRWLRTRRAERAIRNDDVSLLRIQVM